MYFELTLEIVSRHCKTHNTIPNQNATPHKNVPIITPNILVLLLIALPALIGILCRGADQASSVGSGAGRHREAA